MQRRSVPDLMVQLTTTDLQASVCHLLHRSLTRRHSHQASTILLKWTDASLKAARALLFQAVSSSMKNFNEATKIAAYSSVAKRSQRLDNSSSGVPHEEHPCLAIRRKPKCFMQGVFVGRNARSGLALCAVQISVNSGLLLGLFKRRSWNVG